MSTDPPIAASLDGSLTFERAAEDGRSTVTVGLLLKNRDCLLVEETFDRSHRTGIDEIALLAIRGNRHAIRAALLGALRGYARAEGLPKPGLELVDEILDAVDPSFVALACYRAYQAGAPAPRDHESFRLLGEDEESPGANGSAGKP